MNRGATFTCLLAAFCALLAQHTQARPPATGTKITHTYEDEFIDPIGSLDETGRTVTLTLGGPAATHPQGTTIDVLVVVSQPESGAVAIGHGKGVPASADGPETATFSRIAHAVADASFEEGFATACYFAETRIRGKVVRQWSRCEEVLLLRETDSRGPTLKGPLAGTLRFDQDDPGFAVLEASGHLTLMGKVVVYGEFQFVPGEEEGSQVGIGVAALEAANGDILVANVLWEIDADGNGDLEFRWPGEVEFADGTTVSSTGRFVELPFAGLRGTSSQIVSPRDHIIRMTGEIIDPDPL